MRDLGTVQLLNVFVVMLRDTSSNLVIVAEYKEQLPQYVDLERMDTMGYWL